MKIPIFVEGSKNNKHSDDENFTSIFSSRGDFTDFTSLSNLRYDVIKMYIKYFNLHIIYRESQLMDDKPQLKPCLKSSWRNRILPSNISVSNDSKKFDTKSKVRNVGTQTEKNNSCKMM